jgi:ribosomal-protein-alanine acetyltransferase
MPRAGQGGDAAMTVIRPLRGGDLREVLAIVRQVLPEDSWTLETAKGWLARSPLGAQARNAARFEQFIRLTRLGEIVNLVRLARTYVILDSSRSRKFGLAGLAALGRPTTRYCIVAAADGTIAGYACLNAVAGGQGDVQTIAVRGDRQGEGIGTALLADLIATAAARGCRDVSLHVRADNARARLLYRRTGFTEAAVRPGYYQPSGADAVVMRLRISRRIEPGNARVR